ncbi:MAG: response regulator [Ectothiorhodospiraceae bacterium]|nr:response regulator [Ectothiorhodospiraceae bacterium]MCH8504062.1 response regulator [Ectothiorhodospiraceae bacterium]
MAITKVLVVDDSSADLLNLQQIIEGAGYRTLTARSGKEAVETARSEKPDVIFLDIIMDEMDGFEACRHLSKDAATKQIPVVFVTSKNQKADRVWAEMQGAKAFITKPYSQDAIIAQLSALQ